MAKNESENGRGTVKLPGGKFRTPKLSDAQKRANKLARSIKPTGKSVKTFVGGPVPF